MTITENTLLLQLLSDLSGKGPQELSKYFL